MSQQYSTVHFWFINRTDAISLPLTRPWGCEGYDEAGGLEKKTRKKIRESTGQAVTRAGRAGINTDKAQHLKNGLRSVRRINISLAGWN